MSNFINKIYNIKENSFKLKKNKIFLKVLQILILSLGICFVRNVNSNLTIAMEKRVNSVDNNRYVNSNLTTTGENSDKKNKFDIRYNNENSNEQMIELIDLSEKNNEILNEPEPFKGFDLNQNSEILNEANIKLGVDRINNENQIEELSELEQLEKPIKEKEKIFSESKNLIESVYRIYDFKNFDKFNLNNEFVEELKETSKKLIKNNDKNDNLNLEFENLLKNCEKNEDINKISSQFNELKYEYHNVFCMFINNIYNFTLQIHSSLKVALQKYRINLCMQYGQLKYDNIAKQIYGKSKKIQDADYLNLTNKINILCGLVKYVLPNI